MPVDLMTSLSHPSFTENIGRLAERGWSTAEVAPLRFIEIHARVERLLGEPVPKSSVKNYLAKRSKGRRPLFDRVGRGWYRLTSA
jgi:hypothetical protein